MAPRRRPVGKFCTELGNSRRTGQRTVRSSAKAPTGLAHFYFSSGCSRCLIRSEQNSEDTRAWSGAPCMAKHHAMHSSLPVCLSEGQ